MSDQNAPPSDPAATSATAPARAAQPSSYGAPPPAAVPLDAYNRELTRAQSLEQQLAQAKAETAKLLAASEESKVSIAKLGELHATTEAQRQQIEATSKAERRTNALRFAALSAGAIDPDEVVKLTSDLFVVADDGSVLTNDAAKLTPTTFLADYLAKKPHLARARVAQGSGAPPFTGTAPGAEPVPQFDMRTREGATASLRHLALSRLPKTPGSQ